MVGVCYCTVLAVFYCWVFVAADWAALVAVVPYNAPAAASYLVLASDLADSFACAAAFFSAADTIS